jgi:hypothetical protein
MLYCECPCVCCDTQVFLLPDGSTGEGIVCPSCGRPLRAAVLQPFGEPEWLVNDSPGVLAAFDEVRCASKRKRRLFSCHCCRLVWNLLTDQRSRIAVEVAERAAEGAVIQMELDAANQQAVLAAGVSGPHRWPLVVRAAVVASHANPFPTDVVRYVVPGRRSDPKQRNEMARRVSALLRCIFGNPFHPVTLAPDLLRWRDGLLVSVAKRMYDARDFSEIPVLADMLQDAGCDDEQVLDHCRQGGEHARGCFAIDSVLGRG